MPALGHRHPGRCNQLSRHLEVAGCLRVRDCASDEAVIAIPAPGAPMQLRDELGLAAAKLGARVLSEQVVIPVGQPLLVERDHEQVGPLQLAQRRAGADLGAAPGGQRIAQRSGQFVEHAGVQEEVDHLVGLAREHALGEEVHGRGGTSLLDPLGSARSHGCIRIDNGPIAWIAEHVPLGAPVEITS
ncbi:MAG: L,D-transpeptidase [Solirubrobacterales bacterium]|nr:L,D-transpeptidase [Solirubrobacterales bacterium]